MAFFFSLWKHLINYIRLFPPTKVNLCPCISLKGNKSTRKPKSCIFSFWVTQDQLYHQASFLDSVFESFCILDHDVKVNTKLKVILALGVVLCISFMEIGSTLKRVHGNKLYSKTYLICPFLYCLVQKTFQPNVSAIFDLGLHKGMYNSLERKQGDVGSSLWEVCKTHTLHKGMYNSLERKQGDVGSSLWEVCKTHTLPVESNHKQDN